MKYEWIAQHTLKMLQDLGADHAEVRLSESDAFEVSGSVNVMELVRSTENAVLRMTVLKDQKKASTVLNDLSEESRQAAAEALIETAIASEPDEAYCLSVASPSTITLGHIEDTPVGVENLRSKLVQMTQDFVKSSNTTYPKVKLSEFAMTYGQSKTLLQNTNGTALKETAGEFSVMALFNAADEHKSSSFNYAVTSPLNLDKPFFDSLYWQETLARNEKELETTAFEGRLEGNVILTPACFSDLLGGVEYLALSDTAFIQDFSKWRTHLGEKVADEKLTWRSEPLSNDIGSGYGITGDGYMAENLTVIENGVLKTFLLSEYAARKTGRERAKNQGGIYIVEPGTESFDALVASIDKGVLIGRLSGGNPSPNGDFSGIAKNSFFIENGRVTGALTEAMATFNLFEVLADIDALSAERHDSGSFILPYLKTQKILVTGK